MKSRVWFSPQAHAHALLARAWWRANRSAAPEMLADEIARYVSMLSEHPEIGRPYPHPDVADLRRVYLPEARYHLYYVHDADSAEVEVVAFWSALRGRAPTVRRSR